MLRPTSIFTILTLLSTALAARPFLNEPDTDIENDAVQTPDGSLIDLARIQSLPDMEFAARKYLNPLAYARFRSAAAGEYTYRTNLESFQTLRFRPRMMVDIRDLGNTLTTTILGYNFSLPVFISPCANAALINPEVAERGLIEGAFASNILYIPSLVTSLPARDLAAFKPKNATQIIFQQSYAYGNATANRRLFSGFEALGVNAIVLTVDAVAGRTSYRAFRQIPDLNVTLIRADDEFVPVTWTDLPALQNLTSLPIILKGIQSVEDVLLAIEYKVPAVILSNHGGRQLDGAPTPLEIAMEIRRTAPWAFDKIEILADGGVRYGSDVLKLLALGVKAVGLGRSFMFANMWGTNGVVKATQMLRKEIVDAAGNMGLKSLSDINENF
ncbi:Cytochrome b2, mitochondrial [Sphaceloma murrayae]|uniref:Cytochrome b2, mitochondrial n=1 Tax=Sphaceloma murrayae TaxID=2082308 RepID=A0A2K1QL74_9PEZI|nr:Cytochrome b2, mitochondrial [Sphaceloma murrayae]